MNSVLSSAHSLMQLFNGKTQEFISEIDNDHMVWLEEIQQEANRMFSRDFNAEPELMPKTPSQKKNSRRKRVSLGRQEEGQTRPRSAKGRRSNLRGSAVKSLNLIAEEEPALKISTPEPKRSTRKNKQTKSVVSADETQSLPTSETEEEQNKKPVLEKDGDADKKDSLTKGEVNPEEAVNSTMCPPSIPSPEVVVKISSSERSSAELAKTPEASPGRAASKISIADTRKTRRSSARCSLKLRHSLAGLRHSMTHESVRRASQRSMLKRKTARTSNSTTTSRIIEENSSMDTQNENTSESVAEDVSAVIEPEAVPEISDSIMIVSPTLERITRSMAANSDKLGSPALLASKQKASVSVTMEVVTHKHLMSPIIRRSSRSTKRKAPDTTEDSPTKRLSPPKKSQSAMKPSMRSFLHTVQKNQMLMMTPSSLGRSAVIKSFIKQATPLKIDPKTKERYKLEALKKKQEQEEERMRKMEEEKKKKQEELRRKREERIRKVFEAKVKEEMKEEEKKKKIEQKMAQIDVKNDKQRQVEEKAKKKVVVKRQEELEQKKKIEEEAKKKKQQQQEEEKRQHELLAKKKVEEEEQARKAMELRKEQEREKERERLAAAERERVEKEKALALQRELERAAREKERRELEEKRRALEEKRKLEEQQRMAAKERALKEREEAKQREAAEKQVIPVKPKAPLNVTVDIENSVLNSPCGKGGGLNVTVDLVKCSPQTYAITPMGANKTFTASKSNDDYGMDQNSDDSTDDESAPRKPIPSWAEGPNLTQLIMKQYFNPPDLDSFFGVVEAPKLENIFYKSKPRYFKRTSSAVWHSPPATAK